MSKGCNRRPRQIGSTEMLKRWNLAFPPKWVIEQSPVPRFCEKEWEDTDGTIHVCYLDHEHGGECICGPCEEGWEHNIVVEA